MIRPRFGFTVVLLLVVVAAVPLAAQVNDTYVIPAVGNTPGAGTTRWLTEFHVFNPQAYTLTITADYLPSVEPNLPTEDPIRVDFVVDPNTTAYAENVLDDVFETTGRGSLLVAVLREENPGIPNTILARSFLVTSRTYNSTSSGTYGQAIPGVWAGLQDYDTDGISAIAAGIRNRGTLNVTGYRTNVGAVNLGDFSITMYLFVYDSDGDVLESNIPFTIPPQGHVQDRLPVEVDHGSVEFIVDDPRLSAVVFPYASVVDNRTGDSVYVNPVLLASPQVLFPKKASAAGLTDVGVKISSELAAHIAKSARNAGRAKLSPQGRISRQEFSEP